MRKRYSDQGYGYSGSRRQRYAGATGPPEVYPSKYPGAGARTGSIRYNTISGYNNTTTRYPGYRERTKSAPPLRRHRSKSEDSSLHRRRSCVSPWSERRTVTSFSLYPQDSYTRASSATPRRSRSKYDVDRQSRYYSRRAQSFIDKRYLPSWQGVSSKPIVSSYVPKTSFKPSSFQSYTFNILGIWLCPDTLIRLHHFKASPHSPQWDGSE